MMIIPDDEKGALIDRWYYGKHDIEVGGPPWAHTFRPNGEELAKTVVENLGEWFERLWNMERKEERKEDGEYEEVRPPSEPPNVSVMSVRRNGRRMSEFKDGLWEIQEAMGDMRVWKTWTPPERS